MRPASSRHPVRSPSLCILLVLLVLLLSASCVVSHKPVTNENSTRKLFQLLRVALVFVSLCELRRHFTHTHTHAHTWGNPTRGAAIRKSCFFSVTTIFRLVPLFDATKRIYYLFIHPSAILNCPPHKLRNALGQPILQ